MSFVHRILPTKMRRNLKLVICLTVSWMFVMVYYFQTTSMKVIYCMVYGMSTFGNENSQLQNCIAQCE